MEKMYDVIIIGSGPAGLTAGIYARRARLKSLVIEKNGMSGGQIINTYEVDNYPGFQGINGFDLAEKFREHCNNLGTEFVSGEVVRFDVNDKVKKITLDTGEIFLSRAIIIATGAVYRKLGVEGEEELSGMGVSYCATCDGAFFKNKVTAVVGGGDVAVEDAIFLSRICKKVYVIHRRDEFRAAKSLVSKLNEASNVEILWDTVVEKIMGGEQVEKLAVRNVKTEKKNDIAVDGVFIAVGTMPASQVYKEFLDTDDAGYIIAGENCETNVKGVFAAGDIRTKELKQIITAAADGANSITAVERYLNNY